MNKLSLFIFMVLFITLGTSACDNDSNENNEGSSTEESQTFANQKAIEENFKAADLNGDGVIDEEEIEAELLKDFLDMDVDNDGEITENDHDHINDPEYQGIPVTAEERAELVYDLNDDEVVTFDEYNESTRTMIIEKMDINDNGEITLQEAFLFVLDLNL
ncbi:MAG: hypothetical protein ACR2NW_04705 [Thermodesulfobacteriota bacterium]